jgi:uncharacterized membrane protein
MKPSARALSLAAIMAGSGVNHLVRPQFYDWMIPPELGAARPWVTGSGVLELVTAALIGVPGTRRVGGWAALGILVAVLPAHAQTLRATRREPAKWALAAARIPFQWPMLTAALAVARGRRGSA